MGERTEGDEGIVGRAAAEDFGAGMTNVRISCGLMDQSRIDLWCSCLVFFEDKLENKAYIVYNHGLWPVAYNLECTNVFDQEET